MLRTIRIPMAAYPVMPTTKAPRDMAGLRRPRGRDAVAQQRIETGTNRYYQQYHWVHSQRSR
ncbi:hypothetical protein [Nocardia donostiensis]|uniref:hypothetical protein n=1 Tax=Nocardia donostiensis TaxID=1538463 RepID=UPI00158A52AE|nr:hypothetical protein [Nocardia donostiensis]